MLHGSTNPPQHRSSLYLALRCQSILYARALTAAVVSWITSRPELCAAMVRLPGFSSTVTSPVAVPWPYTVNSELMSLMQLSPEADTSLPPMTLHGVPSSGWQLESEWMNDSSPLSPVTVVPTATVTVTRATPVPSSSSLAPLALSHTPPPCTPDRASAVLVGPGAPLSPTESLEAVERLRKRALHRDLDAARRGRERSAMARLQALLLRPTQSAKGEEEELEEEEKEAFEAVKLDKVAILEAAAQRLVALQQRVASLPSRSSSFSSPPIASAAVPSSHRKHKSRFHARKVACALCRSRKSKCDGAWPCTRCVMLGRQNECAEPTHSGSGHNTLLTTAEAGAGINSESFQLQLRPSGIPSTMSTWSTGDVHSSASLLSPPPFGAFPGRGFSKAHQSRLLLNIHIDRVPKQLTSTQSVSKRKGCLRDEYVYWSWLKCMMTEEDVEAVVHTAVSAIHHWHAQIRGAGASSELHHSLIPGQVLCVCSGLPSSFQPQPPL